MSFKQVLILSNKFAQKTVEYTEKEKFRAQRIRFEQFAHDFSKKLNAILNEMEGDIRVMKEKNFDKDMWKMFVKVYRDLLNLSHHISSLEPYKTVSKIVEYVTTRPNKPIIDNLDFLIQHHLKENEVDFGAGELLTQAKVRSLRLIKALAHQAAEYMAKNPALPTINEINLSGVSMAEPEEYQSSNPDEATNPGAKKKPIS